MDFANKVEKFVNCRSKDPAIRELYIVEGDSALTSCKLARNAEFQAIIPVRGKTLNCLKASPEKIMKNDIILDLDVSSLYPSVAKSLDLYPAHLGPEFMKLYSQFIDARIEECTQKLRKNIDKIYRQEIFDEENAVLFFTDGSIYNSKSMKTLIELREMFQYIKQERIDSEFVLILVRYGHGLGGQNS